MMLYNILIYIHVGFTLIALLSGLAAMIASPKGSRLHKRSGLLYFYSFIGVIVTGFVMVVIQYKDLFLGITLFNAYLLFMGYRVLKHKHAKANWLVWLALIIFAGNGLLLLAGALRIDDGFWEHGYKWSIVRAFLALLTFYLAIKDLVAFRSKHQDKKAWLFNHMEKMLITYISLIAGVMLRLLDHLPVSGGKWLCWIVPYVICIPLISYWVSRYKSNKLKPQTE
jgi:hypothetical protein